MKVETDNKSSLAGHIVSYSKDKNDVYSLSSRSDKIAFATDLDVNNDKASFKANGKTYTANANTIFIVADSDPDSYDDYDFTVYTGVKNVPDIDGQGVNTTATTDDTQAVVSVKEGTTNLAKVVYIEDADVSGAGQVIFAKANEKPKYTKDQDGKVFDINVIIDGEAKTIKVKEGSTAAKRLITDIDKTHALKLSDTQYLVALEGITENADGLVTSVRLYDTNALVEEAAKGDADGIIYGTGMDKSKDDVVTLKKVNGTTDSRTYTWADGVVVAQYDDKSNSGEFESSKMSSIKKDDNDTYLAVMDDGVIIGLLTRYVADDAASDGTGTSTTGNTTIKYEISKNGRLTMTVEYDRPDYMAENKPVKLTFDVYANGAKTTLSDSVKIPANKDTATVIIDGTGVLEQGDEITIENVKPIEYSNKVIYKDQDGKRIESKLDMDVTTTALVADKTGATAEKITIKMANTSTGNAAITIANTDDDRPITWSWASLNAGMTTKRGFKAVPEKIVEITINMSSMNTTYTVEDKIDTAAKLSTWGVTGADKDQTLTVDLKGAVNNKVTGIVKNGSVTLELTLSGKDTGIYGYRVVCEELGIDTILTTTSKTEVAGRANSDVTLTTASFEVTPVEKLKVKSFTWDAGKIVITFNEDVKDPVTVGSSSKDINITSAKSTAWDVAVNGNVVTITSTAGDFAAADTVAITAGVKCALDNSNAASVETLTLA